ncbi:transcription regulatory SNF2 [Fusarium heterosporum]|uniref:Transcription regulatory SNF2 n=1 Tax=Fusarium heterosporum TaxID=42747 RepID=A0A8H5TYG0_FUSHE|nr:transcription regulatory SNF2 [Fusarium heterosporum]
MEEDSTGFQYPILLPTESDLYIPEEEKQSSNNTAYALPSQDIRTQDTYGLTERQAHLFMIYVHKLAPLSDACDDARHFALEVPRLALQQPMIMNGLLAIASRYDNLDNDLESTFYHSKCIELLINAFTNPPETWDTTLLIAVVIARLYEENDNETDSYYHHLNGTQNLLNHQVISRFVMQGGLAEAASWVHLRQAIYVYVARRKPVEICLENFERSTVFRRYDDSAYANRAVYIFAKIMKLLLPMSGSLDAMGGWEAVEREVDGWYEGRPLSFKPIYYRKAAVHDQRPFPAICYTASVPVIAMQHYYAAKAVLCLHKRNTEMEHDITVALSAEKKISGYLCTLMGLALSNEHAGNAFYLPAHMLSLCGHCIQNTCEREHTIRYLRRVDEVIKWKTSLIIDTLQTEWGQVDQMNLLT